MGRETKANLESNYPKDSVNYGDTMALTIAVIATEIDRNADGLTSLVMNVRRPGRIRGMDGFDGAHRRSCARRWIRWLGICDNTDQQLVASLSKTRTKFEDKGKV